MSIQNSLNTTPIAIIGMSSIFADADHLEKYWANIIEGVDGIRQTPERKAGNWIIRSGVARQWGLSTNGQRTVV